LPLFLADSRRNGSGLLQARQDFGQFLLALGPAMRLLREAVRLQIARLSKPVAAQVTLLCGFEDIAMVGWVLLFVTWLWTPSGAAARPFDCANQLGLL